MKLADQKTEVVLVSGWKKIAFITIAITKYAIKYIRFMIHIQGTPDIKLAGSVR